MEVKIADTFIDSLKRMARHQTWWYKTYEFFRYDIWRFLGNVWRFRKALNKHYWWDHHGMLTFMELSLIHMSENIKDNGLEIDESRLKKVEMMNRAVQIIQNYNNDSFIEMAEKELGELHDSGLFFTPKDDDENLYTLDDQLSLEEEEHNRKVYSRANEIAEQEWNELFEILKGQDYSKFDKNIDFYKQFDGSGVRGWWD